MFFGKMRRTLKTLKKIYSKSYPISIYFLSILSYTRMYQCINVVSLHILLFLPKVCIHTDSGKRNRAEEMGEKEDEEK